MTMAENFLEIKRHLNKPDEEYRCILIRKVPGHVVLRYISERTFSSSVLGITFPPGCSTIALYWEEKPYVFWAIYSPRGKLFGYLVHICKELVIKEHSVSYLDMLLDVWFFPDGRKIIMDEDEVEECLRAGRLREEDADYIYAAKALAVEDFAGNAENAQAVAVSLDFSARAQ